MSDESRQLFGTGTTADGHALQNRIQTQHTTAATRQTLRLMRGLQATRGKDTAAASQMRAAPSGPWRPVHIDLRGPHSPGIKHELYQLLIVDEHTRYAVGYTLTEQGRSTGNSFERVRDSSQQLPQREEAHASSSSAATTAASSSADRMDSHCSHNSASSASSHPRTRRIRTA